MDVDDPERAKVKSQIQSKIYQKQYQEQLQKQVDGILTQMQTQSYTTISDYLDECYTDGFIGTIFDAHGQDVPMVTPIDQEAMVRAVQLESKISKGLYTRLGEDVALLRKKITAEVSRGIATGMTFAQTAKQLEGYTRIGYNNAIRIARTEGHRIQTTATMDAMTAAKEKGADVVKQWDSTLDGRTRHSHALVDGEIRELNKPFSNGLDFPGDPDGKAAEVVNCRCALLQRAKWAVGDGFTKWNSFTEQLDTFESPEDYGEFKKSFFTAENKRYMNYVQQMQEKYKTENFAEVLDKMTEREYKHYSKLLSNNPIYNVKTVVPFTPAKTIKEAEEYVKNFGVIADYSKYDISVANAVNETLQEIQSEFGETALDKLHKIGTFPPGYSTRWNGVYVRGHTDQDLVGSLWLRNVRTKNAMEKLESVAKEQHKIGHWSTPEALHTVRHELGHAVADSIATPATIKNIHDYMEDVKKERLKRNRARDYAPASEYLSDYGFTNVHEFIAESVAEYLAGNPRPTAIKVVELLKGGK